MKWEPDCRSPSWCECEVEVREGFHHYRKGIVRSLNDVEDKEWDRWVPTVSANAKAVLRSLLPSLAQKCLWYAVTKSDMKANFRSLFWGIGWHHYPSSFWKPPMRRFIDQHDISDLLDIRKAEKWVAEGRSKKMYTAPKSDPPTNVLHGGHPL